MTGGNSRPIETACACGGWCTNPRCVLYGATMEDGDTMKAEVRFYNNEDARREALTEMFKAHVAKQRGHGTATDYSADIEYLDGAILSFADECALLKLQQIIASPECEACGDGEDIGSAWDMDALVKFVKALRQSDVRDAPSRA